MISIETAVLLCLSIAVVAALAIANGRLHARLEKLETGARRARMLESNQDTVCKLLRGLGDRVVDVEHESRRLAEQVGQLENKAPDDSSRFRHAISLAARGATPGDIAADCGLGRAEADLVALLHQHGPDGVVDFSTEETH